MIQTTLEECLMRDPYTSKIYGGVLARDELPVKVAYPSCYIINNKPRHHSGEHWLALYYDSKGHADFFDAYGNPPSYFKLEAFVERTSTSWSYNSIRVQGFSSHCGYYSLIYLLERSRNKSHNFFSFFSKNFLLNDIKVDHYISLFSKHNTLNNKKTN